MLRIRAGEKRSLREYAILSFSMSLVAGAVNSSGLLAAGAMTSHMTGNITRLGEGLALGTVSWRVPAELFLSFLFGAFAAAAVMRLSRPWIPEPVPALLAIEALLLSAIALGSYELPSAAPITGLLCFCMGWQNALITTISGAVVRTTHVTGATTDLGIELATLLFPRRKLDPGAVGGATAQQESFGSDLGRAATHLTLVVCFLVGATGGPLLFVAHGYAALIAPAGVLMLVVLGDFAARRFGPSRRTLSS